MNIQKFIAPTSREALAKARHAYGDATLILSNRTTSQGVEVMATTDEALNDLGVVSSKNSKGPNKFTSTSRSSVEEDADQLAMSTLSFQDYVRERMLRRRHEAAQTQNKNTQAAPAAPGAAMPRAGRAVRSGSGLPAAGLPQPRPSGSGAA